MSDAPPPDLETPEKAGREPPWGRGLTLLTVEAWPVLVITGLIWLAFAGQLVAEDKGYSNAVYTLGALSQVGLAYGLWWTPLTHMFLHAGWLHIVMNSAALIALGPALAQRFGRDALGGLLFTGFYLICGLFGGATFLLLAPHDVPAIGASGAIFGLWGAAARLAGPGEVKLAPLFSASVGRQVVSAIISNLLVIALGAGIGLVPGQQVIGIAWQAHLGGFLAGILLVPLMPVRFWWLRDSAVRAG